MTQERFTPSRKFFRRRRTDDDKRNEVMDFNEQAKCSLREYAESNTTSKASVSRRSSSTQIHHWLVG